MLSLIETPKREIIFCITDGSEFVSDVSELDFRWSLASQRTLTKSVTLTNIGISQGTVTGVLLPTGFFTSASFPQTVAGGASIVIPIYFEYNITGDYSNNAIFTSGSNNVLVSLLGGVESKGLQFDGVNDYVISTQDVSWERTQAWTFFAKYEDINFSGQPRNCFFSNTGGILQTGIAIGQISGVSNAIVVLLRNANGTNELLCRFTGTFPTTGVLQITYDGSSLGTGLTLYINGASKTRAISVSSLTGSIVIPNLKGRIGRFVGPNFSYFTANTKVQEVSFVNYLKSGAELTADYTNGFQDKGSGDWLFRQSFNIGTTSINLKADVLGGNQVDMTVMGQTVADIVNF
jgi:hypothetical protein